MKRHKNKSASSIALATKNSKTSESMKAYHEKRRLEKEKVLKIEEALSQRVAAISSYRDALRVSFTNITADICRNVLESTKTGYFLSWSDLCDYMLESDPALSGMVQIRTHNITSKDIMIEAADGTPNAIKAADFIRAQFKEIKEFDKLIRQLLMGIFKGVACAEIIYKRDEKTNIFQIEKICPISMKRVKARLIPVDDMGDAYQTQISTGYGDYIWSYWNYGDNGSYGEGIDFEMFPGKFLVFSPGDEIEIQFRGILRSIVKPWFYKQAGEAFWASGIEKYAFPVLYAKVPVTTPENIRSNIVDNLNNLANDASMVVNDNVSLNTIATGTTGGDNAYKAFTEYWDAQAAKRVLGSTLTVNSNNNNRSNGEIGERTIEDLVYADAASLASMLKDQLVRYLLEYNLELFDGIMPPIPQVSFDVSSKNFKPLDQMAIDAGAATMNEVRAAYGLSPWTVEQGGERIAKSVLDAFSTPPMSNMIIDGGKLDRASTAYNIPSGTSKKKPTIREFNPEEISLINSMKEKIDNVVTNNQSIQEDDDSVILKIEKSGDKYIVKSKDGTKNLGEYDSLEEAKKRLQEIEYFKKEGK